MAGVLVWQCTLRWQFSLQEPVSLDEAWEDRNTSVRDKRDTIPEVGVVFDKGFNQQDFA